MKSKFEIIRYNGNLPARIEILHGGISVSSHWHKEIELIYVSDGTVTVNVCEKELVLDADRICLINATKNHSVHAENATCLILDISLEFANRFNLTMSNTVFDVVTGSGAEEEILNLLWRLSRTMNKEEHPELQQYALISELLHVLYVQCQSEETVDDAGKEPIMSHHIELAIDYVNRHYQEDLTGHEIADMLGLHPGYFCSLFTKTVGIAFREYLLRVRLEHAMDALINQQASVEEAAKAGGFPSKRTFVAKCKRAYNITPFQMLKQQQQ